ncbi:eCIS core domain-containing protein [Gloeocapsopsis dulcis]|uniref:OmpA-like domain-containing protein n=1 Tax=Gloeocapsopsis dulcis AAB1 = 1H9 TaxID=1433147 RepID=A0A6N8FQ00_9CHRO|nr:DUF4157 domain-containing protein [Gloeocapsopsis dulcis]MUL34944.1 hypothetical protein [Gloeocapsopsis dulcis AAB1 = 1H9]WNN89984.1 DUF4157 domain-containing protein [Gloeocapsopsis dulcis]
MILRSPTQTQTKLTPSFTPIQSGLLQRKCASCDQHTIAGGECAKCQKKRSPLQRRSSNRAEISEVPPIVHEVLRSPGQPLDSETRTFMESRFNHDFSYVKIQTVEPSVTQQGIRVGTVGDRYEQEADRVAEQVMRSPTLGLTSKPASHSQYDFSQVQIHADAKAANSARAINAQAYTLNQHLVFGAGQYAPQTTEGKWLLAHELTHVIQQTGGGQPQLAQLTNGNRYLQRKVGDERDLQSERFKDDEVLQAIYDGDLTQYLRIGSTGAAVEKVQQALVDAGYPLPQYGVDGKFGSETAAAVSQFKQDNSILPSDPVIGIQTIEVLDALFASDSVPPRPTPPQPKPQGNAYELGEKEASLSSPGEVDSGPKPILIPDRVILFDFGVKQSELKPTHRDYLQSLVANAQMNQANSRGYVRIVLGYTDVIDREELNVQLRRMRAEAVIQFLLQQGVPASNIKIVRGAPIKEFLADNNSREGRSRNRAVVVELDVTPNPQPPEPQPPEPQGECNSLTPSTLWSITSVAALSYGAGGSITGIAFLLKDRLPNGCEHHMSFIGIIGFGGGLKIKGKSAPFTLSKPSSTDFKTQVPVRFNEFNCFGRVWMLDLGYGIGISFGRASFSAFKTDPEWPDIGGYGIAVGASLGIWIGRWVIT